MTTDNSSVWTDEAKRAYAAALIDGEGSIGIKKNPSGTWTVQVQVGQFRLVRIACFLGSFDLRNQALGFLGCDWCHADRYLVCLRVTDCAYQTNCLNVGSVCACLQHICREVRQQIRDSHVKTAHQFQGIVCLHRIPSFLSRIEL